MRKIYLMGTILATSLLAACNMPNTITQQTETNTTGTTQQQTQQSVTTGTNEKVTIYIDKNCEAAGIQQCSPEIWKQQLAQVLGSGDINVVYLDKKTAADLKKIVATTPVLEIPEASLSKFGPQAAGIKAQAKQQDGKYYVPLYGWIAGEENLCNDGKDNNGDGKIDAQDPTCLAMTVLTSSKCKEQYCDANVLKNMFMGYTINTLDYTTTGGKAVYDKLVKFNGSQTLPTFLFNEKKDYVNSMNQFVKEHPENCKYKYQLDIPQFKYDPSIEACATNCNASPACKKLLSCNKTAKPNVELFVMSYCPFGTQAEKGILGAVNALKGKIDFNVKFVNYAMHGKKEIDENTLQYCIQKVEPTKYNAYLTCFLDKGNTQDCLTKNKIDMKKVNACVENTKKEFKIDEDFNNKASWVSGQFPRYRVQDDLNQKYGVQGSPTLVINGIKVQPRSRSPQAYLEAICNAFSVKPAECTKQLSDKAYDPNFGWTQNGQAAPAGSCGGK